MSVPVFRAVTGGDKVVIADWPSYPPEFGALDYALRSGGWLDEFGGRPDVWCDVVEDGGEMVALVILAASGAAAAEFRLALHPGRLGCGLGTAIIPLVLQLAARRGLVRLHLLVRENNPRARRLYAQAGFVQCGHCIRTIQGRAVRFIKMDILLQGEDDETGVTGG